MDKNSVLEGLNAARVEVYDTDMLSTINMIHIINALAYLVEKEKDNEH